LPDVLCSLAKFGEEIPYTINVMLNNAELVTADDPFGGWFGPTVR